MSIKFRTVQGKCSAKAEGMLTIYTALENIGQIAKILKKSNELTLDLSKISEFDTAGLQLVMLLKKETENMKIKFSLLHPSECVKNVLDTYHMTADLAPLITDSTN